MYNYFTSKKENKMDSFVAFVVYDCITKSMIERLLNLFFLKFPRIIEACFTNISKMKLKQTTMIILNSVKS